MYFLTDCLVKDIVCISFWAAGNLRAPFAVGFQRGAPLPEKMSNML